MTRKEKNRWIKKFKNVVVIPEKKDYGGEIDRAFGKLYDLIEDCRMKAWPYLKYRISNNIPDIYFGSGDEDEVTDAILQALDTAGTWRDIAAMLESADVNRDVFVLSDDGHLYPVDYDDFITVKEAVIKAFEDLEDDND